MSNRAWVTLATNDSYGLGALVLAHSLRRVGSAYPAVVLVTPALTDAMRDRLSAVFAEVITVDVLDSRDDAHLALLARPELGITFTKIHCWSLTQYEKCVFLDADTLVAQNCDELFEREELSAAPDVGWPDCFNSGVFVFKPSKRTFDAIIKFAQERGSFDGGDQGLLNSYFSDWARGDINKHLPFLYNVTSAAFYSYLPAFKHFGQDLKIIHFIGVAKPWLQNFNWDTQSVDSPEHLKGCLQLWWDIFVSSVHTQLDANMVEESPTEVELYEEPTYYTPEVNPDSEFPWHHINSEEVKEEDETNKIDFSQVYDPWAHHKGTIPLHQFQESDNSSLGRVEITSEFRKYIWEYKQAQDENAHVHDETYGQTHQSQDSKHWESPYHHDHLQTDMRQSGFQRHHQTHNYHHIDHHNNEHSWSWKVDVQVKSHSLNHSLHDHTPYALNNPKTHNEEKKPQLQVHNAEIKPEKRRVRRPRTQKRRNVKEMNGDLSGSESDQSDVIIPRHPYDGFYLRHRSTFDCRGRKICTHEVPSISSPSPPQSPLPETAGELEDQTGVAGVLARVSGSGTTSSERGAAIDELTRRQGWEQGNIDYMGADSFDNIWAKISQTLNKSPPKEPSPPKEVKQPSPQKDQAPAPVHQEIPVVPVPVEKTAVVEQTPAPVESTQIPAPAEQIAAPVETSKTLVESTATAKETPVPKVDSPAEQASEQSTPGPCKLVSESTPEEIEPSQPKESVVPSVIPVEEPKKATAVVPPTPPVTPKSTSESSTPVTESLPVVTSTVTPVTTKTPVVSSSNVSLDTTVTASAAIPDVSPKSESVASQSTPVAPESLAKDKAASASPAVVAEAPVSPALEAVETAVPSVTTPEKSLDLSASTPDSPPLAHTPGKEDSSVTPAKSGGERGRKPAGKLMLSPPAAADALPTPDSELEDAASLAQSIIAGELAAPALASPTPATPALPASPPAATEPERLAAAATPLDTPPAGPVSLAQIGVKTKPSTAAQIESSLADPAPATPATTDPPKKKLVKKVVKKDTTAASGDAPVPPPRKKEKKPKEK